MAAFAWTIDPKTAREEQGNLQPLVQLRTTLGDNLSFRRGIAIGTAYDENSKRAFACGVFFGPDGRHSAKRYHGVTAEVDFPYVPGLLAYRVGPAVCQLLDTVVDQVDLLLLDGQGISHARGFGLACHIGVLYDKPTVGVTRSNLYGMVNPPPAGRFNRTPIINPRNNLLLGYAVSLGDKCQPIYVSPGHRLTQEDAVTVLCRVAGPDTCFPSPLRRAHAVANATAKRYWRSHQAQ